MLSTPLSPCGKIRGLSGCHRGIKKYDPDDKMRAELAKVEARVLNHVDDAFKPLVPPPRWEALTAPPRPE
jgi:hypothetical protein